MLEMMRDIESFSFSASFDIWILGFSKLWIVLKIYRIYLSHPILSNLPRDDDQRYEDRERYENWNNIHF